jgi:hypothetical protein
VVAATNGATTNIAISVSIIFMCGAIRPVISNELFVRCYRWPIFQSVAKLDRETQVVNRKHASIGKAFTQRGIFSVQARLSLCSPAAG